MQKGLSKESTYTPSPELSKILQEHMEIQVLAEQWLKM